MKGIRFQFQRPFSELSDNSRNGQSLPLPTCDHTLTRKMVLQICQLHLWIFTNCLAMCMDSLTVSIWKKHENTFNNLEQQSNHHNLFASLSLNVLRCKKQTLYIQTIKEKTGQCWTMMAQPQIITNKFGCLELTEFQLQLAADRTSLFLGRSIFGRQKCGLIIASLWSLNHLISPDFAQHRT